MKFLIIFLSIAVSIAALGADKPKKKPQQLKPLQPSICPLLFSTVPLSEYWPIAKRYEITRSALTASERQMVEHLVSLLKHSSKVGTFELHLHDVLRDYSAALSMRVRGFDTLSSEYEQKIAFELAVPLETVQNSTRIAAEDPTVYRASSMAEFLMRGFPTIEAYLFGLLLNPEMNNLKTVVLEQNGEKVSTPFVAGPRQIEMVRNVLQYSFTNPGDSLLEIGYGTPAVSLGVAFYTGTKILAVDLLKSPENMNSVLAPYRVEAVRGRFPDSTSVNPEIKKRAPYKVIFALDTLRKSGGVLKTDLAPQVFIKTIYDLLADDGTLVILNDFMDLPNFAAVEATQAGFKIVRWGFRQSIPRDLIPFIPYLTSVEAGEMALYVLRKGEPKIGTLIENGKLR